MSIAASTTLVHLPFAERQAYGSPYPIGMAVGHIDQATDATGGTYTASCLAQDQFLYRLEVLNVTKDDEIAQDVSCQTIHEWATAQSGAGALAFTLDWQLQRDASQNFTLFTLPTRSYQQIRRFPIGSVTPDAGQFVSVVFVQSNVDAEVWDFDWVFSYWPKTALYLPGFLSSFFEAPEVAPPVL